MRRTPLSADVDPDALATRQEFAAALTVVRETAGLTVREVARAAGISASTVGGYFSGRHLPPLRPEGGIRTILAACGVVEPEQVEAWQRALVRVRRAPGPRPAALPPPYRGLTAYRPEDTALFHGREAETLALADRLLGVRPGQGAAAQGGPAGGIVVLLGRAGCGKSSLVQAGLTPLLRARGHFVEVLAPGPHPVRDLADALSRCARVPAEDAREALRAGAGALRALLEPHRGTDRLVILPDATGGPADSAGRPVLVVDPLEHLFTGGADPVEQRAFTEALAELARPAETAQPGAAGPAGPASPDLSDRKDGTAAAAPVAVLVVVRSESAAGLAALPALPWLAAALNTAFAVPSMADDALRRVILEPARLAGVDVESTLVDAVLEDAAALAEEGVEPLPPVSHALLATWRRARRGRMTLAGYREAGGVPGSVGASAEAVPASLTEGSPPALPAVPGALGAPPGQSVPAASDAAPAVGAPAEGGLLDPTVADPAVGDPAGPQRPAAASPVVAEPADSGTGDPPPAPAQPAAPPPPAQPAAPAAPAAPATASGTTWWHQAWLMAAVTLALLLTTGTVIQLAR